MQFIDKISKKVKEMSHTEDRIDSYEAPVFDESDIDDEEYEFVFMDLPSQEDVVECNLIKNEEKIEDVDVEDGYVAVEIMAYEVNEEVNGIIFMHEGQRVGIPVDKKVKGVDKYLIGKRAIIPFNGTWGFIDEMTILY